MYEKRYEIGRTKALLLYEVPKPISMLPWMWSKLLVSKLAYLVQLQLCVFDFFFCTGFGGAIVHFFIKYRGLKLWLHES